MHFLPTADHDAWNVEFYHRWRQPDWDGVSCVLFSLVAFNIVMLTQLRRAFDSKSSEDASKHAAFEASFCDNLVASGRPNFAGASGCTFSWINSAGMATGANNDIQVTLKGMLQDFSAADASIFDTSVEDAFNEAFKKAGYTISGVRAVANLDISDAAVANQDPVG